MTEFNISTNVIGVFKGGPRRFTLSLVINADKFSDLKEGLDKMCVGLANAGLNPGDLVAVSNKDTKVIEMAPANGNPEVLQEMDIPKCETCATEMKVSSVQRKKDRTAFFCPQKLVDGYCKSRATVDNTSFAVDLWRVK